MISCSVDQSGQILTISYGRKIGPADMRAMLDALRALAARLHSGFILLSDLTNLEAMDPDCAADLGLAMDLLREQGMSNAVRVIPDPKKDIGFNIISVFHFPSSVKIHTRENLAEGVKAVLVLLHGAPMTAA